jgi:hypothetical protein
LGDRLPGYDTKCRRILCGSPYEPISATVTFIGGRRSRAYETGLPNSRIRCRRSKLALMSRAHE